MANALHFIAIVFIHRCIRAVVPKESTLIQIDNEARQKSP